MSETINKGYRIPEVTDSVEVLVDIFRDNFRRLANHNHTGENSDALNTGSFPNIVQTLPEGSGVIDWGARDPQTGLFSLAVAVPEVTGGSVSSRTITMYDDNNRRFYADFEVVDDQNIKIYSNTAIETLTIHYA